MQRATSAFLSRGTPLVRSRITTQQRQPSSSAASVAMHATYAPEHPWIIVGKGRVGEAFADMSQSPNKDALVGRGEPIVPATHPSGPIVVCTRNDDLDAIIDATPPERREDLVFIQNGSIGPFLDSKGLADATQVLVYFAVAAKGEAPTDGKTDTNPEGLTGAYGKHAQAIADRLRAAGLSCKVYGTKSEFQKSMLEKLVWICAFMAVGAMHGPDCTVGDVEAKHTDEVGQLILELYVAGCNDLGIEADTTGLVERLCAYARSVSHFPTAVKEFPWRNGYFYGLGEDVCPKHTAALKRLGVVP